MNTTFETANSVMDFNETEQKVFASRVGDRWAFTIPAEELNNLKNMIPNHVLVIEHVPLEPTGHLMVGKLVKMKDRS